MSLWSYVKQKKHEILTSAAVAAVGFFLALLANSYVDEWKERRVFASTLNAIKGEATSNETVRHESFLPLYKDGLVLRDFSTTIASQALANPAFVKHASTVHLQALSEYVRELSLANAYRLRISANVTGDFGNVTDFDRLLGCAGKIVGMGSV
ncbi:hypothetical protein [Piscinibacter sp.]|jgi:hypothetical protein|uniref:hypothetical protein n=1 Tax=Piscinibacter sp. TaxID=1903157 RepID=UPI00355AC9D3